MIAFRTTDINPSVNHEERYGMIASRISTLRAERGGDNLSTLQDSALLDTESTDNICNNRERFIQYTEYDPNRFKKSALELVSTTSKVTWHA